MDAWPPWQQDVAVTLLAHQLDACHGVIAGQHKEMQHLCAWPQLHWIEMGPQTGWVTDACVPEQGVSMRLNQKLSPSQGKAEPRGCRGGREGRACLLMNVGV